MSFLAFLLLAILLILWPVLDGLGLGFLGILLLMFFAPICILVIQDGPDRRWAKHQRALQKRDRVIEWY
jgi:hypothetical protein